MGTTMGSSRWGRPLLWLSSAKPYERKVPGGAYRGAYREALQGGSTERPYTGRPYRGALQGGPYREALQGSPTGGALQGGPTRGPAGPFRSYGLAELNHTSGRALRAPL